MKNPNGPYPGRQLFLGLTSDNRPGFAYLVTGRSPESRQRKAVMSGNTIIMGPLGDVPYDPLRHYTAVKYDPASGVFAVTNGIQTEAIYETYKLMINTGSVPDESFMQMLLEGAKAEPDSYHTARIAGVIYPNEAKNGMKYVIGLTGWGVPAKAQSVELRPGMLTGVSTYQGELDKPVTQDTNKPLPRLDCTAKTAEDLAKFVFDSIDTTYQGNDIRVTALGGVYSAGGKWELAIRNVNI
jgi:IMP cyclohydrolase